MAKTKDVPAKAHPLDRREPLPWQEPKSKDEDPFAPQRVAAILKSPSYRRADEDVDFLAADGVRGVRLQIDYLKPELMLDEHHVHSTIVVFGSTRICEPQAAQRKGDALTANLSADPRRARGRELPAARGGAQHNKSDLSDRPHFLLSGGE